jgi:hypothetical protein
MVGSLVLELGKLGKLFLRQRLLYISIGQWLGQSQPIGNRWYVLNANNTALRIASPVKASATGVPQVRGAAHGSRNQESKQETTTGDAGALAMGDDVCGAATGEPSGELTGTLGLVREASEANLCWKCAQWEPLALWKRKHPWRA